jgi:hypothetical protein
MHPGRFLLGLVVGVFCLGLPSVLASGSPPSRQPHAIVIGFVGGLAKHDDPTYLAVQIAGRLRQEYGTAIYVEVFENTRRNDAHNRILQLLDGDHDGTLSSREKQDAHIIVYGQSWGASETVALARQLDQDRIPVLLTIQVDSVAKLGENDQVIPSNVAEAANFYQPHGIVHGRRRIHAESASTHIIGNYQFDYSREPVSCRDYPWFAGTFFHSHTEIECDPRVWSRVESLIRSKLPPLSSGADSTAASATEGRAPSASPFLPDR